MGLYHDDRDDDPLARPTHRELLKLDRDYDPAPMPTALRESRVTVLACVWDAYAEWRRNDDRTFWDMNGFGEPHYVPTDL